LGLACIVPHTHQAGMTQDEILSVIAEVVHKLPDLLRADLASKDPSLRVGAEEIVATKIAMAVEDARTKA
jgi:hypothetical protein